MANVLTTTDPQIDTIAELMARNRPPWPVGVAQDVQFSPWDVVIESLADLAPFDVGGGVFSLPTGSYAFAAPINLGVGQVRVPVGSEVLIKGFGTDKVLSGTNPLAQLLILGDARVETLAVTALSAGAAVRVDGGVLRANQCIWTALTTAPRAVEINGVGQLIDSQSVINSALAALLVTGTGGRVRLSDCNLNHTVSGVSLAGGSTLARFAACSFVGRSPVTLSSSTSAFESIACDFLATGGPSAITISAAQRVSVIDGTLNSSGAANVNFAGNADHADISGVELVNGGVTVGANTGGIILRGLMAVGGSAMLQRTAGTVNDVVVSACRTNGTTTNGIVWAAANMPTRGMMIVGNSFGMTAANAFSGFVETDARVNAKANVAAAGTLLAETPTVP